MKKMFLMLLAMQISPFVLADGLNAINDPVMNPCIQRPDLAGCSGNNQSGGQARRIYKVPNRWGAIYFNPVNRAVGYSENNTEGERSARREALASCIKAGGGQNPIARDGKGCRVMNEFRNTCSAFAVGGKEEGKGGLGWSSNAYVKKAEAEALEYCREHSNECVIRYSGCSRHPDYRY
ncbi:DUF4189 domain-containing protein [Neisseria sicca]|uniref:DUF4189 domain-containing protein n=1 Tax=Neisseria sicca TaxID=490 RepID=UPI000D303D1D|nr:DUF4189 domain-containing protein [Neisseria sicca]